jgi:hypothetical protein
MITKPSKNSIEMVHGETVERLYSRLPKVGEYCSITGLSRNKLNTLVLPMACNNFNPPVKSISLKEPGKKRGNRIIDFKSLTTYLASKF